MQQTIPQQVSGVPQALSGRQLRQQSRRSRQQLYCSPQAVATAPETLPAQKKQPFGRLYNFSAGPACLPLDVLQKSQAELLNWNGSGMSVMEMSHRSKAFTSIITNAEQKLRQLLDIPGNYKVMFLQGGATAQFSAVPLNLTSEGDTVDQLVTGSWSKKAAQEAEKYGLKVNVVCKGDNKSVPSRDSWKLSSHARYVHYCDNETIQGVEFKTAPDVGDALLVADMSSNFCSKKVDVSKFGLIYAGAQKNIGPAGVVVVIVREDLMGKARQICPVTMDYETMKDSLYNTPPCWSIYICSLMFDYLLEQGGLEAREQLNQHKADILYDTVDSSNGFYAAPVHKSVRSRMNVPFVIPSKPELEKEFVSEAAKLGMTELKGHRSVGGMRASIYNSMPMEGIESLAAFMKDFAAKHS
ncbi:hypothetical protein WJX74_010434 [Apatococcus lobatus]|uniref:phosphoserine transaminase n=1 Tax=Apatococcus lobatus TaxID=904363 RepID=A0AAW1RB39_9CHLO